MNKIWLLFLIMVIASCTANRRPDNCEINSEIKNLEADSTLLELTKFINRSISLNVNLNYRSPLKGSLNLPKSLVGFETEKLNGAFVLSFNEQNDFNIQLNSEKFFLIGFKYESVEHTELVFNEFNDLMHNAFSDSLTDLEHEIIDDFFWSTKPGVFLSWFENYILILPKSCNKPLFSESWVSVEDEVRKFISEKHVGVRDRFGIFKRNCNSHFEYRMQELKPIESLEE